MSQELCKALRPPYVGVPRLRAIPLRDEQSLHVHDHSLIDGGLSHRPISAETRGGRMAAWDKSPRHAEGTLATLRSSQSIRREVRSAPLSQTVEDPQLASAH